MVHLHWPHRTSQILGDVEHQGDFQMIGAGRVVRVRALRGGGWRVRLADTGGALAAAEIHPSNPIALPPVGALIVLYGRIRYDEEHNWYVVDPLEEWFDARITSSTVSGHVSIQ